MADGKRILDYRTVYLLDLLYVIYMIKTFQLIEKIFLSPTQSKKKKFFFFFTSFSLLSAGSSREGPSSIVQKIINVGVYQKFLFAIPLFFSAGRSIAGPKGCT